ncbi:MAG: DUF4292 domain-containing protein [Bacteroidales bacterium]|nr:DUF4292 domain-containing protein [Bacteroidales bacterium]
MSLKNRIVPIMLGLALVAAGCRSQRDGTTTGNASTPTATSARLYTANFSVSTNGLSANGQMRMMEDSIIWISASKVLELGRAKFTPDSVMVYAVVMNRYFKGTYDELYQRFQLRTDFKTLSETVRSADAGTRLAEMARPYGIEATIVMEPWKEMQDLTFPFAIPKSVKPL